MVKIAKKKNLTSFENNHHERKQLLCFLYTLKLFPFQSRNNEHAREMNNRMFSNHAKEYFKKRKEKN